MCLDRPSLPPFTTKFLVVSEIELVTEANGGGGGGSQLIRWSPVEEGGGVGDD